MTTNPFKGLVLLIAAVLLVAGCDGGDGKLTVPDLPPVARFTATPDGGTAPLPVQFDATSSSDGGDTIARYVWVFGDGSPQGSGVKTSHVYEVAGTYNVTLWVTDQKGVGRSTTRQISVRPVAPTLVFSVSPTTLGAGEAATLSWEAQAATSCVASGGWTGARPVSGSTQTAPLSVSTTFTLNCSGPGGEVSQSVTVQVNVVGGQLLVPAISRADSDVNDPAAPYRSNDTADEAQLLPNPVIVGGYLNEPGRGPVGRSSASGDLDDVYKVTLAAGQIIELVMPSADPALPDEERDDADLALYDESVNLVDAAFGIGQVEQLTVPAAGVYYVRVALYSGAPLYRLSIGQSSVTGAGTSLKLSDEFVPGEVVVTLRSTSATGTERQKASASLDAAFGLRRAAGDATREMRLVLPGEAAAVLGRKKPQWSGARGEGFAVPPELRSRWETLQYVKLLRANPTVRSADPNYILRASVVPNDPYYSAQRWHYEQIELPAAWSITRGSADVVVAVVDTGTVRHPDLIANLVSGYDFISSPSNQDGDGIDPVPDDPGCVIGGGSSFHGTHVAGTVAAVTDNATGVAGVAGSVRLMPVRVLDGCTGLGNSYDVLQGVRYAAGLGNDSGGLPARRADIINLSLGSSRSCDTTTANLAAEVRAQGVIVVAAAGNENTSSPGSPASCPNVISVAAVGPTAQRAPYSNFGSSWVDVAAPGGDMRFDANGDGRPDGIFSTHATGGGSSRFASYELMQGTSMAAPHVAGVLALMKSVRSSLTPAEVDTLLVRGELSHDIGVAGRDDLGVGLISAFKAVQAAGATPPSLPATLTLAPSALSFGDVGTLAHVVVTNGGTAALVVTGAATSAGWLRVTPDGVDKDGLGRYAISVERAGLAVGSYSGWVEFDSSAGSKRVSVLMQVVSVAGVPDAGWQYVLLMDPGSFDTVVQTVVRALGERVPYRFGSVRIGDYVVVAGTDMNNDGYICEDGEACGAYPVEGRPVIVSVAGERLDIDFSTAFRTSPQAASSDRTDRGPTGFARKR